MGFPNRYFCAAAVAACQADSPLMFQQPEAGKTFRKKIITIQL
jgi:hypothetical protein